MVDNTLLLSQRNTDNRPIMDNPGEAKVSPRQTMDSEEEIPFFMRYSHLVPTARSLAPESEEDELSSSSEFVDKEFDKKELLIGFQANINVAISTAISEVISKLPEHPVKKCGDKQCRKNLCDREEKHLTEDTRTGSVIMQSKAASQHSKNIKYDLSFSEVRLRSV